MSKKTKALLYVLRVFMTVLCITLTGFIVYNSIQTGEASAAQSSRVVDTVQEVARVIAPESKIATATGEEYDILHNCIRTLAHITEFLMLGFATFGSCLSFTLRKRTLLFPSAYVTAIACFDEILQTAISGRVAEFLDVIADMVGAFSGGLLACIATTLVILIYKKGEKHGARKLGNSSHQIQ